MEVLRKKLLKIDGKGYKLYKGIQGIYKGNKFKLYIDYVQGDPFASPSRLRIDLSFVEQLVDPSQTRAIAFMIKRISDMLNHKLIPLKDVIDELYKQLEEKGLETVSPFSGQHPGDLALPRKFELAAAINRLRTLQVK